MYEIQTKDYGTVRTLVPMTEEEIVSQNKLVSLVADFNYTEEEEVEDAKNR